MSDLSKYSKIDPTKIKSGADKIWKRDGKDKLLGQSAISTYKFIIVTHYL